MNDISAGELKRRHDAGDDLVLLDVREPDELAVASIPWATAMPMGELPSRFAELPRDKPVVVMCHHGGRSTRATHFLEANGFTNALNLAGGIDAWAALDPTVPQY